jgi:hypothetical protein
VSLTVTLASGKLTCTPAKGSNAECLGGTGTAFAITIPAGSAAHTSDTPVHLTLVDAKQQVVFDKTAAAIPGPPLGCGDCWAGYVSY